MAQWIEEMTFEQLVEEFGLSEAGLDKLRELVEAKRSAERDRLKARVTVEHGWHGNPENHTLRATLFFGRTDPRDLIKWDDGHGYLSDALLDLLTASR